MSDINDTIGDIKQAFGDHWHVFILPNVRNRKVEYAACAIDQGFFNGLEKQDGNPLDNLSEEELATNVVFLAKHPEKLIALSHLFQEMKEKMMTIDGVGTMRTTNDLEASTRLEVGGIVEEAIVARTVNHNGSCDERIGSLIEDNEDMLQKLANEER